MKRRICIIIKTKKPGVEITAKRAKQYFLKRNYQVFTRLNKSTMKKGLNWILVLSGDGGMLNMANKVAIYGIPLIGVNFGHKGYLCQIPRNKLIKGLGALNSENFSIKPYTRIKAKILRYGKLIKKIDALNEIVVGGINRAVWLGLKIRHENKKKTAIIVGDGIIFSTQIGSTAYNIYSGGPLLLTDVFSVVACNALFESDYFLPNTRAFVIPTSAHFQVKALRGGQHLPYVVADGQRDYRLHTNDKVIITRSSLVTKLIELKK